MERNETMHSKETIIYTGNFSIENMNAAGKRVFANAMILMQLGYHLVMVGIDTEDKTSVNIFETKREIKGIEVYHYPGWLYQNKRLNYRRFFYQLESLIQSNDWEVRAIVGYNSPSIAPFIGRVLKYCHSCKIKYITDVADWLIVDSNNLIFRFARQVDITLKNAYYSNKSDGIIAISTWLAQYYEKRVKNVIVIPPLAIESKKNINKTNEKSVIVYAGIPFREGTVMKKASAMKDRFDMVCEILLNAKKSGSMFEFHVYGFTKEQITQSVPSLKNIIDALKGYIFFHGKTSMEAVQKAVSDADYTILIREKNRMTMAGFPTKVSESITCGTPVITTKTSDIDKYIPAGRGAYYLDIDHMEENSKIVSKLLSMSQEEREAHKRECNSNTSFKIETYIKKMDDFMKAILDEENRR